MSLIAFLKSKKFLFHLFLVAVVIALTIYLTMLLLKVYTHHGKVQQVPDFIGLSEKEVQFVVTENKLRYNLIDSLFVPEATPGTIIAQHPESGYNVKRNRTIYLTIAAISPEKVLLPKLVDVSLREAQSRIENAGLKLGAVEYVPSEFMHVVLKQKRNNIELPEDTLLIKGTAIDLVVGKGPSNERTMVPELVGNQMEPAKEMLYNVGLNVGAIIYDNTFVTAEDSLMAIVWKQYPKSDSTKHIGLGRSVDLWLTIDTEKIDFATNNNNF